MIAKEAFKSDVHSSYPPSQGSTELIIILVMLPFVLLFTVLPVIAFWKICERVGFNGALGLLMLVPIVNIIISMVLANGIRELIYPEWVNPDWIPIIAWVELILIALLLMNFGKMDVLTIQI